MSQHPEIQDFESFLRDPGRAVRAPQRTLVTRHLITGCGLCYDRLRAAGWGEERLLRLLELSGAEVRHAEETEPALFARLDYDPTFALAAEALAVFFGRERPLDEPADHAVADLLRLPEGERLLHAVADPRFAHPEVVRTLLDQSHAVRYDDPQHMLHLADLARRAAGACTAETAGNAPRLADLRARAWGQYGNALRVCGQLHDADEALATAERLRESGTRDPLLRARLLEHTASLRTFQGRFHQAIEMADDAAAVYRELGETHCLATTMVQKAIACLYAGETEAAVRTLNRAIPLIDPDEQNPHLLLAACHNLIRGYIDLDRPEQALSLYFEARELYKEFDSASTIRLRAGWQEGQLLRDLGHLSAAETALCAARQGFLERGIAYEVALVSLDLASVYVRAGKVQELQHTVTEAVPIFRALHVGREAIAALLQLQQAAGQEQALELIRQLNTRLAPLSQRSN
jgi:tetratricopeptide (TPR) repeat protein